MTNRLHEAGYNVQSLIIDHAGHMPSAALERILQELQNPSDSPVAHILYCRDLGQLGPLQIFRISAAGMQSSQEAAIRRGQRAGDGKPLALDRNDGWEGVFHGVLLVEETI